MMVLTSVLLLFITLLVLDSADDSLLEYQQEKQRVEQSLKSLSQVLKSLDYHISALYSHKNEEIVLSIHTELVGQTCRFTGQDNGYEGADFVFSGPSEMCNLDSPLYDEAKKRLFIAPSISYIVNSVRSVSAIYFVSKEHFVITSPQENALKVDGDVFKDVIQNRPYWNNSLPSHPEYQINRVIYTGGYQDYLSDEEVVTLSRSIIVGDDFKGVLAIDIPFNDLIRDKISGYHLTQQQGNNHNDVFGFTFSEPLLVDDQETGLFLTVDEPKRVHIVHALKHQKNYLIMASMLYLFSLFGIWYRYSEATKRRLKSLAMHDPLSGLLNRRGFEDKLKDSNKSPFIGIGVFDIDDFKLINDRFGHEIGDEVICHVAHLIANSIRQTDTVARFGGEEFVVAVAGESESHLALILERVQRDLSLQAIHLSTDEKIHVTLSGGACIYATDDYGNHIEVWREKGIRQADKLLYHAKKSGKNRVSIVY
ncbi:sensor domain-containing diguanylate cyclase [Vibrio sinensis]|uniref:diguanylate cyclase n=2 Tax=Vibrio sinensis TaxID=2302434 RepID=A0A3A6QTR6_9VIBR|nr:sensor domain-containing diguanylate cyclase [Vibrio sinensis]